MKNNILWCFVALLTTACGPQITKKTRFDWRPYNQTEDLQTSDGVTVENKRLKSFPSSFFAETQMCNRSGELLNEQGKPVIGKVAFHQQGQVWFQLAVTNDTDHIIRMNRTVIRYFDPAGNQFEPLSKDDLMSDFMDAALACPSHVKLSNRFKRIKLLDGSTEILPKTTVTGWVAFRPDSLEIPGMWKFSLYEVPVATDEAGKVTKTTNFDIRSVVKKYVDTYRSEDGFSAPKLVSSKEVTD